MKKISIITNHNVDNSYSCLFYLKNKLSENYIVKLYSRTSINNIALQNRQGYICMRKSSLSKIKGIGGIVNRIYFIKAWFESNAIIINDLDFFIIAYVLKRLFPGDKVIHYNTEIHGLDVPYKPYIVEFYKKHADFPDLVIECLNERANYRKKEFDINSPIVTINNTIPQSDIENALSADCDIDNYFKFDNGLPIVIYAGGCDLGRSLGDVIKCSSDFKNTLNFMFFCHGSDDKFNVIKDLIKDKENCLLYHAVDRVTLLNIMNRCNIGIQYYNPEYSINHLYASPSKFYEYLSVGLNVISTNNEGINKIIDDNKLGVCIQKGETMSSALSRLLKKGLTPKSKIKRIFAEKYCYEKDSQEAIEKIKEIIG